jgi:uncharacterized protein (TIGR00290 family)
MSLVKMIVQTEQLSIKFVKNFAGTELAMESGVPMNPIMVSWSGGKDSCLALHELLRSPDFQVMGLLTTIMRDFDRISMHGVRTALLEEQAEKLGQPLRKVLISKGATNAEYETKMAESFSTCRERGIDKIAFGDLFLEDIKAYRDQFLARHGMTGVYPIWKRDTAALIRQFIAEGFKTIVVCVDPKQLDSSFAGRVIDQDFLKDLPPHVDPCGENGEFHTFVYDGPIFRAPVTFSRGEVVCRDLFWFCDLVPREELKRDRRGSDSPDIASASE